MDKRLPLALLLSLVFIWLYIWVTAPIPKPGEVAPAPESGVAAPGAVAGADAGTTPIGPLPGATIPPAQPAEPSVPSRAVAFAGEGYRAQFETAGASLEWLELTDYFTEPGSGVPMRLLGSQDDGLANLLLRDARDTSDRYPLDRVNWAVTEGTTPEGRAQLVFSWTAPDGMQFTRTVTAGTAPYSFDLGLKVTNTGATDSGTLLLVQQAAHGLVTDPHHSMFDGGPSGVAVVGTGHDKKVEKWSGSSLKEGTPRTIGGNETLLAAGSMSNYFTTLLVPHEGTAVSQVVPEAVLDPVRLQVEVDKKKPANPDEERAWREKLRAESMTNAGVSAVLAASVPAPGESASFDFTVYAGPKDRTLAERPQFDFLVPILEDSFGRMAWINHALLAILRFFESLTGNWGFAIILLTLLVRMLLFPMNRLQQSTMAKYSAAMARLKPDIDALKARYKGNTRKFNEEQMKLLRSQGVSPPLGGCLLMFIQFPIWISLFQILRTAIELRHAPWIGWVHDLSRPDALLRFPFTLPLNMGDTLNILPILMALATMVQMRSQPRPADESQAQMQKIMGLMMPVMMLFFLYGYPSGLSLYIFTSSLLGIIEYRVIRKFWPPPGMPTPAPRAADARVKG